MKFFHGGFVMSDWWNKILDSDIFCVHCGKCGKECICPPQICTVCGKLKKECEGKGACAPFCTTCGKLSSECTCRVITGVVYQR